MYYLEVRSHSSADKASYFPSIIFLYFSRGGEGIWGWVMDDRREYSFYCRSTSTVQCHKPWTFEWNTSTGVVMLKTLKILHNVCLIDDIGIESLFVFMENYNERIFWFRYVTPFLYQLMLLKERKRSVCYCCLE